MTNTYFVVLVVTAWVITVMVQVNQIGVALVERFSQ
jgi:hypothetical protein